MIKAHCVMQELVIIKAVKAMKEKNIKGSQENLNITSLTLSGCYLILNQNEENINIKN